MFFFKPIIPEQTCLSSKPDRVIFLDIDGVIRTQKGDLSLYKIEELPLSVFDRKFCKQAVSVLNESYSYVKYDIVVISTWRNFWNITDLKRIFKENGISANVIGLTGVDLSRGLEIQNWVASYTPKEWIVIDDSITDIVKYIEKHKIINPVTSTGLSDSKYVELIVNLLA